MTTLTEITIAILLFVAAIAAFLAELALPAHGVLIIASSIFGLGAVFTLYAITPIAGVIGLLAYLILQPIAFFWAVKRYPNSWIGRRIMLREPPTGTIDETALANEKIIGQTGITLTPLRPAGMCQIAGKRRNAVSEFGMIEPGMPVEVVGQNAGSLIVRSTRKI
jgi:membrane-bound serine protease (ClpP class)